MASSRWSSNWSSYAPSDPREPGFWSRSCSAGGPKCTNLHEKYDYPDDSTLTYHAVHAGLGVAFLPEWTVGDDLAAGRLALVLPAYTLPPLTLYAVYTSRQYMTPKLRTFIDFFSEALGRLRSAARPPDP